MSTIQLDIAWPSDLPLPSLETEGQPSHSILAGGLDNGRTVRRLRFKLAPTAMNVRWSMSIAEFATFQDFFHSQLHEGSATFSLELLYPKLSVLTIYAVKFTTGYQASYLDNRWDVSASIQLIMATALDAAVSLTGFSAFFTSDESDGTAFYVAGDSGETLRFFVTTP